MSCMNVMWMTLMYVTVMLKLMDMMLMMYVM